MSSPTDSTDRDEQGSPGNPALDGEPVLRRHNGHTLELRETDWRCLHCGHWFDAAAEANGWKCGDPCVHPHHAAQNDPDLGSEDEGLTLRLRLLLPPDPSSLSSSSFGVEREQELNEQNQAALDLDALQALCDKATPAPWYREYAWVAADGPEPDEGEPDERYVAGFASATITRDEQRIADAAFVAASRSAVPALIAEVARLKSALVSESRLALQENLATKENLAPLDEAHFERDRALALLYIEHVELHPTYGNTSRRGGGIGGSALTQQCSVVDPEEPEFALLEVIEDALNEAFRRWEREGRKYAEIRAAALVPVAESFGEAISE